MIRIPLSAYGDYVQAILKLLYPVQQRDANDTRVPPVPCASSLPNDRTWANQHPFLNISITPIECSLICSKWLADEYIAPAIAASPSKSDGASISSEDYVAISVEGEGLEAGQRVLELTSPLAMAGMYVPSRRF